MSGGLRGAVLLGALLAAGAALLSGVHALTAARSAANARHAAAQQLLHILPPARYDNDLLDDARRVDDTAPLGLRQPQNIYVARRAGAPVAAIVPVTARNGFAGDIDLLVGIYADGRIAGVRVVAQHETRGLGARITGHSWLGQFTGQSLDRLPPTQWQVKKDGGVFDQFTGATITPRAAVGAVHRALAYFSEHRREIFGDKQRGATP